jgi:hypothetical protein
MLPRRGISVLALLAAALVTAACGGSATRATSTAAGRDTARTVWLCRPGLAQDPCASDLTATVVRADGSRRVEHASPAARPKVDCFYVYPTVSSQPTTNATLHIDPEEREVAVVQAARFSQVCRVFAPMYRQLTLASILKPGGITRRGSLVAYRGVAAAFRDYLAHDNHGRGIAFVGHSQGASLLDALLKREVDPKPRVRRLLVSALLLGGNVVVPRGRDVGGDFRHIPACRSSRQTGCVVAYSSFDSPPPANALFGRAGTGINPFARRTSGALQVLCVNPAAPAGGSGQLEPYFPTTAPLGVTTLAGPTPPVKTPWVTYPGEYVARCESAAGATWLQVDRATGSADPRPTVRATLGPAWGLHLVDVNIALGNLVELVREQARAFVR